MKEQTLARNLAMFSLGLGAVELFAPRQLARFIGVSEDNARTLRALGLREIASGLGILQGKSAYFLWSRVAGDLMDLGLLAAAWRSPRSNPRRLKYAIGAVAGCAIMDAVASAMASRSHSEAGWRIAGSDDYRGGIERNDPHASRAACDSAMARHQSGHVREDSAAEQPQLALSETPPM